MVLRVVLPQLLLCTLVHGFIHGPGLSLALCSPGRSGICSRHVAALPVLRTAQRATACSLVSLRSQAAMSDEMANIQLQIETGIIIGLPDAPEEEVEELMAILTVAARSLNRKMGGTPGADLGNMLLDNLGKLYVEEEGLLTDAQWKVIRGSVRLPKSAPVDPAQAVSMAAADLDAKLDAYIRSSGVAPDDGKEMKAIVLALSRSIGRRASQGKIPASDVKATFMAEVQAKLVEEALMSAEGWSSMMGGRASPPATAPPAQVRAPAPRSAAPTEAPAIERAGRFIDELEKLFPSTDPKILEVAAQGQTELEDAVYNVISNTAAAAESAAMDAASGPVVPPDGLVTLQTPHVTTGACCYGMCIDVAAKKHAVTISAIKTASSPGLNWGQGGKIRCKVFVTEGGSRGKELDESKWTLVGEDMELVLPLVSWVDANPEYAEVPLQQPIRIEAGCKAGFLIHTSDLYGLVMSVGSGSGGDVDFWQDEDDDNYKPPFEIGSLVEADDFIEIRAGYSLGSELFEEFDNALMPQPGGLAGQIEYIVG